MYNKIEDMIGISHSAYVYLYLYHVCRAGRRCAPHHDPFSFKTSFVYTLVFGGIKHRAYCDMKTGTGGWTVIQRRQDGSVNFYRKWAAYKAGFGSLAGEFWWGLEKIHLMTSSQPHELRIDMVKRNGKRIAATYTSFRIDSEKKKYKLFVSGFKGYGTSHRLAYHNGMYFTTKDRDNDKLSRGNCARRKKGAWWYHYCFNSHLNGAYDTHNLYWDGTLKFVEMKIRPRK